MALTHTQRTSMFNTLAEVMGQDDAETLMEHLPPSGWGNVSTKEDLRAGFAEIRAQAATDFAQLTEAMTSGFAQAAVERAEAATDRSQIREAMTSGFAQAAVERAEIRAQAATERAEIMAQAATERAQIMAQAAIERAEIIRRQAWHLYIVVSTIVVASVSIWIALFTQPGAGG